MLKSYLVAPGPTPVPDAVLLEMAKPMIHHRTSEFSATFKAAREKLKPLFGTKQDVLILLASGTAAMEAALTNTLSAGDKIVVISAGKFGQRWEEIGKAYNLKVDTIEYEWGKSANAADLKAYLEKNPDTKAVCMQGSETSTTAYHPVKELAAVVKGHKDTLLIMDGITSIGVQETKMDEWGVDIMVTGSQKALMLPPGLAFITLSEKAWAKTKTSTLPKYYLDLTIELKNQMKDTTAWTAGVTLVNGLNVALDMIYKEGLENVYKRHAVCAEATRKGLAALGLRDVVTGVQANSATAVYLPESVDGKAFVKYLREKVGVTIAGGQDHLNGRIIRVAHLGYHGMFDTIIAVSAIEMGLLAFGCDVKLGSGLAACEEVFKNYLPAK